MYTYQRDSVKSQIAQFWWLAPLSFGGSLLDIAPTVLTLFDLPVGRDMDGRPLVSIYEYPPAVRWIDSWDRVPGDAARVDAAPVAGGAATAAAVIRQLADVGLQGQRMAVLLCEQYYDFAEELADQYLVMERGEVIARGPGSEMKEKNIQQLVAI